MVQVISHLNVNVHLDAYYKYTYHAYTGNICVRTPLSPDGQCLRFILDTRKGFLAQSVMLQNKAICKQAGPLYNTADCWLYRFKEKIFLGTCNLM